MHRIWPLVVMLLVCSPGARADLHDVTVEGLFDQCKSNASAEIALCIGYLSGALETMQSVDGSDDQRGFAICPGRQLGYADGMEAFMIWVQRHPEYRSRNRSFGVLSAYHESWPCERR